MSPPSMPGAEDVLRRLQMLEMIVENTSNMVVVTDETRRITWVNAAYSRITGWSLSECLGRRPGELLHGPLTNTEALARLGGLLRQPQPVRDFELQNYKRSGEPYWVLLNIEPILDAAGRVTSYVSIQTDITERKQREQQTADLQARLIEQRHRRNEELKRQVQMRTRQLEEAYGSLEEFSYALSHDLRTPLRHIAGFAELLKEEVASGGGQGALAYCDKIIRAATQMRSLIDGMLSFARLGRKGMRVGPVDMAALVEDVAAALVLDWGPKAPRWRIQPGLPIVQGDPVLLREVWVNLLENALKYASHREVIEIDVGWQAQPQGVVFHVRDNGVGFDPEQAKRLFGMFQRLHRDARFQGAGIGLALVRRIVEHHGGRIWAESLPDQGATFHVFLPSQVPVAPLDALPVEDQAE